MEKQCIKERRDRDGSCSSISSFYTVNITMAAPEERTTGMKVGIQITEDLTYADDTILLTQSKAHL